MKKLENLLLKDWQYKLISLLMGATLWFFINIGDRVPMSLERTLEIDNKDKGYEYKLERKRVRIRLRVMERFVPEDALERVNAVVNVKGLKEGEYTLKVEIKNLPRFLVTVERIEPEYVKVKVIKAPEGGQ